MPEYSVTNSKCELLAMCTLDLCKSLFILMGLETRVGIRTKVAAVIQTVDHRSFDFHEMMGH